MMLLAPKNKEINTRVSHFTREVLSRFPTLDVRFNRSGTRPVVRYFVAEPAPIIFEANLARAPIEKAIYEAILNIKQLTQMFDA